MSRPNASLKISRSALPIRTSSMSHHNQVATAQSPTNFDATPTLTAPGTPPRHGTHNRKLHSQSHDQLRSIPPTPPPPPTQPLPAPPTTQRQRVASATVTRPRGLSNSSVKPRPRAASNGSVARHGGPTPSNPPPAARSAGAARRGTVGSPSPTHEAQEDDRPESPGQRPPQTPEQLMRLIRERTRDSYIRIRERPSVPELSRSDLTFPHPPRSASTRSAPFGHAPSSSFGSGHAKYTSHGMKGGFHSIAAGPVVPSVPNGYSAEPGCFVRKKGTGLEGYALMGDNDGPRPKWEPNDGAATPNLRSYDTESRRDDGIPGKSNKVVHGFKKKLKHILHGFHISVSVTFNDKPPEFARYQRTEMTIRIKNNPHGNCVFDVIPSEDERDGEEILEPVENLKYLFRHDKNLQRSLLEWNRHFQHPPPHWVVNFVPRAYLRRGYNLAEEVVDYFNAHPDGCEYTVEYEPIGHQPCLVGTVVPRPMRSRNARRAGEQWLEAKEKY